MFHIWVGFISADPGNGKVEAGLVAGGQSAHSVPKSTNILQSVLVQTWPRLIKIQISMQIITIQYQLSNWKVKSGLVDTIWQSFWPLGNLYRICNYVKLPWGDVSRIVQPPFINSCTVNKSIGSRTTLFNYLPYFNIESLVDIFQEKIMHFKYHIIYLHIHSHSIAQSLLEIQIKAWNKFQILAHS